MASFQSTEPISLQRPSQTAGEFESAVALRANQQNLRGNVCQSTHIRTYVLCLIGLAVAPLKAPRFDVFGVPAITAHMCERVLDMRISTAGTNFGAFGLHLARDSGKAYHGWLSLEQFAKKPARVTSVWIERAVKKDDRVLEWGQDR